MLSQEVCCLTGDMASSAPFCPAKLSAEALTVGHRQADVALSITQVVPARQQLPQQGETELNAWGLVIPCPRGHSLMQQE